MTTWIWRAADGDAPASGPVSDPRLGPLGGLRLAVKDNVDVAGMPTTAGHPAFTYYPVRSAPAVRRLVEAGAVVAGKTNLDQFATGLVGTRSPFGACRNPYDERRIAGGSSSGSAVAVATAEADLGLTTDTAGSGRVPAALCGLVGIKPTRGLVSTCGIVPAVAGVDCLGVLARTVELAARAIDVASGYDQDDPFSRRPPARTAAVGARLRVGVPAPALLSSLDRFARPAWDHALDRLARLGPLAEVDLGPYFGAGDLLYGGGFVAARWDAFGPFLIGHQENADPSVSSVVARAAQLPAHRLAADLVSLARFRRQASGWWDAVDVLALPTVGEAPTLEQVAADPLGVNARMGHWTSGANMLDLCAVAVPCGYRGDGIPFGATLLGPAFADQVVRTAAARVAGEPDPPPPPWAAQTTLVVVGAHLSGQPLNGELTRRGARLVRAVTTASHYRVVALGTTPPKPGLVRVVRGGGAFAGELWAMPTDAYGAFAASVPPPLAMGSVELSDGSVHRGFVCEGWAAEGATDITAYGGWVAYREAVGA